MFYVDSGFLVHCGHGHSDPCAIWASLIHQNCGNRAWQGGRSAVRLGKARLFFSFDYDCTETLGASDLRINDDSCQSDLEKAVLDFARCGLAAP